MVKKRVRVAVLVGVLVCCLFYTVALEDGRLCVSNMPFVPFVFAADNATNQTVPFMADFVIDRPCFRPTKIIVNYPYTHSHSITDITTIGSSSYTHEGSPTQLVFQANDIDTYTFILRLGYDNLTIRTVLIGIQQGNLPIEGYTLKLMGLENAISVKITLMEMTKYPSEQAVAAEVVHQIEQLIVTQIEANREIQESNQNLIFSVSIVTMIAMICSVITLVLVLYWTGKVRRIRA